MDGVWTRLLAALDADGAGALVSVVAVRGSAPREPGARLVLRADGGVHGTVGGGALEWEAIGQARALLAQGAGRAVFRRVPLGPGLGQCCGGEVTLLTEPFEARDRAQVARLAAAERAGPFRTAGVVGADGRVARALCPADALLRAPPLPAGAGAALLPDGRLLERFGDDATPLLLFGAGHVGRALVLALAPLPFRVRWIDARAGAFPPCAPGNVVMVRAEAPEREVDAAPAGAFALAMTHSHPLDLAIVARALARPLPHVGLIGSATKRARFTRALRAAGLAEAALARLVCPIGVPGIRDRAPAAIAAGVAAALLQAREQVGAARPAAEDAA